MVTTRRSTSANTIYEQGSVGGVGLLERRAPATYNEYVDNNITTEENLEQARERMQRNLDRLLNYDKESEPVAVQTEERVEENVSTEQAVQEDDIRPTLTTMQFGDIDVEQMRAEMRTEQVEKSSYKLSSKGKMVMVLYALAVVVVLALIVLNTGVLSSLNRANETYAGIVSEKAVEYNAIVEHIDSISNNEYVIEKATEMGMVQR